MKDIKEKHRYSQHYLDVIDFNEISLHDIPVDEGLDVIPRYSKRVLVEHDREAERMLRERGQRREIVFVNCEGLVKNSDFIGVMKEILSTLEDAYDYPVDIEYTVNVGEDGSFNINLLQCLKCLRTKMFSSILRNPQWGCHAKTKSTQSAMSIPISIMNILTLKKVHFHGLSVRLMPTAKAMTEQPF